MKRRAIPKEWNIPSIHEKLRAFTGKPFTTGSLVRMTPEQFSNWKQTKQELQKLYHKSKAKQPFEVPHKWREVPAVEKRLEEFMGKHVPSKLKRQQGNLPDYLYLNDTHQRQWKDVKQELKSLYTKARPHRYIEITFPPRRTKPRKEIAMEILEWDPSIPTNEKIERDSPNWTKLLNLVVEFDPSHYTWFHPMSAENAHDYVIVKLLPEIKKPEGQLINQPVKDFSQATPSHPNLKTYWTDKGFLPANQPFITTGDCLPRSIFNALSPKWTKLNETKKLKQLLSIDYICELCNTQREMSVPQLLPFLEKHRIHLKVFDMQQKLLWEYEPASRNKKLDSINLLLHNRHVSLLDHDLKRLEHLTIEDEPVSNRFHKPSMEDVPILYTVDDLKPLLAKNTPPKVYFKGNLDDVFAFLLKLNIEPQISLNGSKEIVELKLFHPAISILQTKAEISTMKPLVEAMFVPSFKSSYSTTLQHALTYSRGHLRRSFVYESGQAKFVDTVRAYTTNLMQLEKIPVFTELDEVIPYDGSLEDYTFYIVKRPKNPSIEEWLIANREYNLVSGLVLKASKLSFKIVGMCRPSSVEPNTVRHTVKRLFNENAPDLKAINIVLGIAGKRFNRKHKGKFSTDTHEAFHFGDNVRPFQHGFIGIKSTEPVQLEDGFYPLYHMVYDLQRLRLLQQFRLLSSKTKIYGVATDGFFVESYPAIPYHAGPKTLQDLGKFQKEGLKQIPQQYWLDDEKDFEPLVVKPSYTFVENVVANTFIEAEIAGAGKTYSALKYLETCDNPLIVAYSDEQLRKLEEEEIPVITYANLLGQIYDDDGALKKTKAPFDVSLYDCVLLDELFQIPQKDYLKCLKLLEGKNVLGTGDRYQNSTGTSFNNYSRKEFYEATMWKLFPNRIVLSDSHRLLKKEDETLIKLMLQDFQQDMSVKDAIQKYNLQTTTSLDFDKHVPFTNYAKQMIEKRYGDRPSTLKFRGYDKTKATIKKLDKPIQADGVAYVMHEGKRIQFLQKGRVYPVSYHFSNVHRVKIGSNYYNRDLFVGAHTSTGHSIQGNTIKEKYCIVEWECASWEWFYTALTRCEKLADVFVYVGESLTHNILTNVKVKLELYRKYDKEHGYQNDLDKAWINHTLKSQNFCCCECCGTLSLEYQQGDLKQWSVDRKDNSQGHTKDNCRITCLQCNLKLANA